MNLKMSNIVKLPKTQTSTFIIQEKLHLAKKSEGGLGRKKYSKKSFDVKPLISIVTIVFNGEQYLEKTIQSVINQTYDNIEYIIIDGGSTDGTLGIIKQYEDKIDYCISERDNGIYDAMNKGITLATGEWLNFMNAGDKFYDANILTNIFCKHNNSDLIYSDTLMSNGTLFECNIKKNRIIHQSLIYKKSLHDEFGHYIDNKKISISDYMFFQLCKKKQWTKTDYIISIFDVNGVSSNLEHFKQKIAVDILFGNISRIKAIFILMIHPVYNKLKRFLYAK